MLLPRPSMIEKRFHPSQEPPGWMRTLAGWDTPAGVIVSPEMALQNMTVLACVRFIAETIGSLPHFTYRRLKRGKERATDHYLYDVLHSVPNPEMTAMTYKETVTGHVALRGNGLSEIEFDQAGRVRALWPMNPDKVQRMERRKGKLFYVYTLPDSMGGADVGLPAERVLHVRWFSTNGLWALSPIALAKDAIGLSAAAKEYIARFFSNGAEPGVVLKTEAALSDKAYDRVKKDWEARHQGLDKSHRIAILEEGLGVEKLGVTNEDAQLLQLLGFGTAEIARLYNISLDMLAETDKAATYASVEQFGERLKTYTIRPWAKRWDQEADRSLLTESERKEQGYFTEILLDALLSADLKTRYESFVKAIQNGFMTPNEAREKENMNAYEGGDVYLAPMNLGNIEQVGQVEPQNAPLRFLGGADAGRFQTK